MDHCCTVHLFTLTYIQVLMEHWQEYSHLTCNIRGDGRKYMLNLKVPN